MLNIPHPVANYLLSFLSQDYSLAYLLVHKDGSLSRWGGNLGKYGLTNLRQGEKANHQLFFLEGLLPLQDLPLFLPHIQTNQGVYTDIHIFPTEEGDWVLLLASAWNEKHISVIQQKLNDFSLLQEKITKSLSIDE